MRNRLRLALLLSTPYSQVVKKLLLLFPALLGVAYCATLTWDPSPSAPPLYRAYETPVGPPEGALWTLFGETPATSLLVTGNVYRMFTVRAVSAEGTESEPSNVVTNHLASTAAINGSFESAPTMAGPWRVLATNYLVVPIDETNKFFRQTLRIIYSP